MLTGKILPVSSTLVATPSASKEVDGVLHAEGGQGRVQEPTRRAVGLDDAAVVGGVGDVAARAAGHEDLDAGLAVLLQQQHAAAVLGRTDGRHQARRPAPITATSQDSCTMLQVRLWPDVEFKNRLRPVVRSPANHPAQQVAQFRPLPLKQEPDTEDSAGGIDTGHRRQQHDDRAHAGCQ